MSQVGLLIIATNNYITFLDNLIKSADEFFLKNQNVCYFIFTNKEISFLKTKRKIIKIDIEHKAWPWMTLGRYDIFYENSSLFKEIDYLFYCDVDMKFVDHVGDEILSDLVATIHPGFCGKRGTPETNPNSLACISENEELQYFAGGFNGGRTDSFLKMSEKISKNIKTDYSNGIIAIWHDESHMNRYFIDNKPTKILNPSYCYPESWNLLYNKKIIALDKNHNELRN